MTRFGWDLPPGCSMRDIEDAFGDDESINLIHGDSLKEMREMESDSFDSCVTDPPFGIGFKYEQKEKCSNPDSYWEWFNPFFKEMYRVVKPGGFFAIWQTQLYFKNFWDWYGDDIHIYCAAKNFVQLRKAPINYGYDPVVMFYKPGASPIRPNKPKRNIDYFVSNTAALVSNTNRPERGHPCPRPLDVVDAIINNFVAEGGHVIDPFMGSGTVGLACMKSNRTFVGIESEQKYIDIANNRLDFEWKEA